jgi:hypothetical protein
MDQYPCRDCSVVPPVREFAIRFLFAHPRARAIPSAMKPLSRPTAAINSCDRDRM